MRTLINNFCGSYPIEIESNLHSDQKIGATVGIYQSHGAMSFQHSMRPAQAREMAVALIAAADELEFAAVADELDALQEGTVAA